MAEIQNPQDDGVEQDGQADGAARNTVVPFYSAREVIRAAEQYVSLKTPPPQKRKVLSRILVSYEYGAKAAPILIDAIHREDIQTRHILLDFFADLVEREKDLSSIAESLAKMLGDQNFALREKVAKLLMKMGPQAVGASLRTIAFLRSKLPDIPLNAIKVLTAIGPACAQMAIPKVEQLLKGNANAEMKEAAQLCLEVLYGEAQNPLEEEKKQARQLIEQEAANNYVNISGKTILVVDDDKGIRGMIVNSLRHYGANIFEASDGAEALEVVEQQHPIDLILLDLMMPGMSGAEFLRLVREKDELKNLPVYVISARTERSLLMAMATLEIAGYFMKPFKIAEILNRVNSSLGN